MQSPRFRERFGMNWPWSRGRATSFREANGPAACDCASTNNIAHASIFHRTFQLQTIVGSFPLFSSSASPIGWHSAVLHSLSFLVESIPQPPLGFDYVASQIVREKQLHFPHHNR